MCAFIDNKSEERYSSVISWFTLSRTRVIASVSKRVAQTTLWFNMQMLRLSSAWLICKKHVINEDLFWRLLCYVKYFELYMKEKERNRFISDFSFQ